MTFRKSVPMPRYFGVRIRMPVEAVFGRAKCARSIHQKLAFFWCHPISVRTIPHYSGHHPFKKLRNLSLRFGTNFHSIPPLL